MTKKLECCECGVHTASHKVYEFADVDGKECFMCDDCYSEHESKGDWVS
jgi:hypothetical protein